MFIKDENIREVYTTDTVGKKYHTPIVSKQTPTIKDSKQAEVLTANLTQKVDKKTFLKMSNASKKEYIEQIREKYSPTNIELSRAIGISPATLYVVLNELYPNGRSKYSAGKRTPEQEIGWQIFIGLREAPAEQVVEQPVEEQPTVEQKEEPTPRKPVVSCRRVTFDVEGPLNVQDIATKIGVMVADGVNCRVSVILNVID